MHIKVNQDGDDKYRNGTESKHNAHTYMAHFILFCDNLAMLSYTDDFLPGRNNRLSEVWTFKT